MPYYHDAPNRKVIYAPATPTVIERKGKKGVPQGWMVYAQLETIRADNYIVPKTQQWRYPVMEDPINWYDSEDSRESAINYFKWDKYPNLPQISREEYLRLSTEYEKIAFSNKPPMPGNQQSLS